MLTVYAHCDLPCGVYDPTQAKIEAQSVKACMEKYAASTDPDSKLALLQLRKLGQIWSKNISGCFGPITSNQTILRHSHNFMDFSMKLPS